MITVVVLLMAVGAFGGYGIGRGVELVRGLLPDSTPALAADKVAPPEPLDLTGPATTCRSDDLVVGLSTTTPTVTVGDRVTFSVTTRNEGRVPCLFDGADASRAVTITGPVGDSPTGTPSASPDDASSDAGAEATAGERVWSSADCASGETLLLLGTDDVATRDVTWKGKRSTADCAKKVPSLAPGTYEATATLADVPGAASDPVTFVVAPKPQPSTSPAPGASGTPSTGPSAAADESGSTTGARKEGDEAEQKDEEGKEDAASDEKAGEEVTTSDESATDGAASGDPQEKATQTLD